jgi:Na+-translocating ferredoxin:NAD+ oxidoreductase RnfD subunit
MPWGSRILQAYITNHPSGADADALASADHSKKERHASNKKEHKNCKYVLLAGPPDVNMFACQQLLLLLLLLLVGEICLMHRGIITWHIPQAYCFTNLALHLHK